jgi:hypothetical protein
MAFSARYLTFLAQEDREDRFLAILQPFEPVSEAVASLYQSTDSYGTKPTDSLPSQRFDAQLQRGFEFAAGVPIDNLAGIVPGAQGGRIRIQQRFGNLDHWRTGYFFDGRGITLLHGGFSEATGELEYDDYGEVFNGELEGQPEVGLDFVDLELRSADQRLDYPICERLHRGIPWMLYGDGVDDFAELSSSAIYDLTALGYTIEVLLNLEAAPGAATPVLSRAALTADGYRIQVNPDRTVSHVTFQAGPVSQACTTALQLPVGRSYMVSFQMLATGTCHVYLDGEWNAFSTGHIAPDTSAASLYLLRNNVGTSFLNAFVAEVRIWNVPQTAANISDRAHRPLSAAELLLPELIGYWKCADGSGSTLADSSASGENGTITGAVFHRALEGPSSLGGERMLELFADHENVTGHLVEANPPIWQLHSDKANALLFGREGGAPRAVNTPFTSRAAFLAATTPPNTVDVLISAGGTYARVLVPPKKKMTFDIEGDASDGTYRVCGPDLVRYWITTRGSYPFNDATELDDAAWLAAAAADPAPHRVICDGETTLRDVCNPVLRSGGWSVWKKRETGLITIRRFSGVAAAIAAAVNPPTLTEKNVVRGTLVPAKARAPVWMVSVYCAKNPTLFDTSDLNVSILPESFDDLRSFLLQEWSTKKSPNRAIRRWRRQARELVINSTLATEEDGQALALRERILWGGQEQALSFLSTSAPINLDVMDAFYFHYQDEDEDGAMQSRLGTSPTAAFICAAIGVDLAAGGVRVTIFREDS